MDKVYFIFHKVAMVVQYIATVMTRQTCRPQSVMYAQNLPNMLLGIFWNIYLYALHFSHYACVMLKDYSIFLLMNAQLKYFNKSWLFY